MRYATFDASGFPTAFYADDVNGPKTRPVFGETPEATEDEPNPIAPIVGEEPNPDCGIPSEAVEISDEQWFDFNEHPGQRRWKNGKIVVFALPPPPPPIITTRMADIWGRSSDDEAALIDQGIQTATPRQRGLITSTMRFDHATDAFAALDTVVRAVIPTKARADAILAPSEA